MLETWCQELKLSYVGRLPILLMEEQLLIGMVLRVCLMFKGVVLELEKKVSLKVIKL